MRDQGSGVELDATTSEMASRICVLVTSVSRLDTSVRKLITAAQRLVNRFNLLVALSDYMASPC